MKTSKLEEATRSSSINYLAYIPVDLNIFTELKLLKITLRQIIISYFKNQTEHRQTLSYVTHFSDSEHLLDFVYINLPQS